MALGADLESRSVEELIQEGIALGKQAKLFSDTGNKKDSLFLKRKEIEILELLCHNYESSLDGPSYGYVTNNLAESWQTYRKLKREATFPVVMAYVHYGDAYSKGEKVDINNWEHSAYVLWIKNEEDNLRSNDVIVAESTEDFKDEPVKGYIERDLRSFDIEKLKKDRVELKNLRKTAWPRRIIWKDMDVQRAENRYISYD